MNLDEKINKTYQTCKCGDYDEGCLRCAREDVKQFIKEFMEGIDKRINQWEALDEDLSDKTGAILSLEEIKHTLIEKVFGKGLI